MLLYFSGIPADCKGFARISKEKECEYIILYFTNIIEVLFTIVLNIVHVFAVIQSRNKLLLSQVNN